MVILITGNNNRNEERSYMFNTTTLSPEKEIPYPQNLLSMYPVDQFIPARNINFGVLHYKQSYYASNNQGIHQLNLQFDLLDTTAVKEARSPHQALIYQDKLYITNTEDDGLIIFDLLTKNYRYFKIAEIVGKRHINSIARLRDQFFLVHHNRGQSTLVAYDNEFTELKRWTNAGEFSHNIWEMDNELWVCDSLNGQLRSVESNKKIVVGGFPRGILLTDDYLWVGVSINRQRPSISQAHLSRIDRKTNEIQMFPVAMTDIYELSAIN